LGENPIFLKFWSGQAVSQLGSAISNQALPLTALLVLGASPLEMGLLNGAVTVLIFGLTAGAWVDRVRRRPIMILADLGRFALLGTIPLAATLHRLSMGQLFLITGACATATLLFDVSYRAYFPTLVGDVNIPGSQQSFGVACGGATGPPLWAGPHIDWGCGDWGCGVLGMTTLLPAIAFGPIAVCATMLGAAQLFDMVWRSTTSTS
jgi:hypothetical protein